MEEIECKYFFEMEDEKVLAPKEKADELIEKFKVHAYCGIVNPNLSHIEREKYHATRCAIISVSMLLESTPLSPTYKGENFEMHAEDYWKDVLKHLEQKLH